MFMAYHRVKSDVWSAWLLLDGLRPSSYPEGLLANWEMSILDDDDVWLYVVIVFASGGDSDVVDMVELSLISLRQSNYQA